jgi:hypothetical protein
MLKEQEQFHIVPAPGIKGWNVFSDSEQIDDQELAEASNIVYDGGIISPRSGSALFTEKPTGETSPLQTMVANTSDGLEYLIGVYANHFYLFHPTNEEWIRINNTYVPAETSVLYGWKVWNNGRGDDRLYVCNGIDNFARWDICVDMADGAQASGLATFTIADGTRFPATGTLVIKGDAGVFTEPYTARTGNVFTLTNTLSDDVSDGASVTLDMAEKADMELGTILEKHGSRLFTANYYGGETTVWYSVLNDPEDFTVDTTIGSASTAVIADGNGEITGMHDFGEFLVIEKEDSYHRFRIVVSEDLASKLDEIKPILSGRSVGTLSQFSTIKMQNKLYYPTRTEGIYGASPTASGTTVSVQLDPISQAIQSYVTDSVSFTNSKGAIHKQKALWSVSRRNAEQNSIVLVFDTLRRAWSKIENWSVESWSSLNGKLYFMEHGTGAIRECFTRTFNDDNNPYPVKFAMKRFNFGAYAQPKTQDLFYVQGILTPQANIYVDVFMNEGGELNTQTFLININKQGVLVSTPLTNAQGQVVLGTVALGYVETLEIGDLYYFRTYLGIDISKGFFNIQPVFRSNTTSFWAITGVGMNPVLGKVIPNSMVLSPESVL